MMREHDPGWRQLARDAKEFCPKLCAEVVRGQRAGRVPLPDTVGWWDWVEQRTARSAAEHKRRARQDAPRSTGKPSPPPAQRPQQKSPSRHAKARTGNVRPDRSLTEPVIHRFSYVDLAKKWVGVQGEQVSTFALAAMLSVPHQQMDRIARDISDMLSLPPWRLRVRRGGHVSCKYLRERAEDLLWRWDDERR